MTTATSLPNLAFGSTPAHYAGVVDQLVRTVKVLLAQQLREMEAANGSRVEDGLRDQLAESLLAEELEAFANAELAAGRAMPTADDEEMWARQARDHIFGLGGLQPYLDMPDVENINIHGHDKVFLRLTGNRRVRGSWPVASSDADLIELIRIIAARSGEEERRFDRGSPLLDTQLSDGSRLNASAWVCDRPSVSIRVHRHPKATMATMLELGVVDDALASFLTAAVRARLNILVAGGPGTGKTTLLRALASEIPAEESLITIEDSRELNLGADEQAHPDVRSFQARCGNVEGEGEITLAALTRNALRMAPDRVIVGEVRGEEVVPMFKAMSQGSDGSMTTIHASDSQDVFIKLASYAAEGATGLRLAEANLYIASAVDLIVQLDYTLDHATRVVSSVREVVGADGDQLVTNEAYAPDASGRAQATGALSSKLATRLERSGADLSILAVRDPYLVSSGGW